MVRMLLQLKTQYVVRN